jgi:hypothetical protein
MKSKNVKDIFFLNVWRKNIFDIYVTEYGTALTTILPILFLYLNTVIVTAGNHRPAASYWYILPHNAVSITPRVSGIRAHNFSGDWHQLHR